MTTSQHCNHQNIYWSDLFQPEKINNYQYKFSNAYCLDCNESKGLEFASKCQLWYIKQVGDWFTKELGWNYVYGLEAKEFTDFIQKSYPDFEQHWQKLKAGKIDEEYFAGIFGQALFWETSRSVEKCCQEFAQKKKQQSNNGNNKTKQQRRKRKKTKLQQDITDLEKKTNKTREEEEELIKKKKILEKLEKELKENNKKPANHYILWIIVITCLLLASFIILLFSKRRKKI